MSSLQSGKNALEKQTAFPDVRAACTLRASVSGTGICWKQHINIEQSYNGYYILFE